MLIVLQELAAKLGGGILLCILMAEQTDLHSSSMDGMGSFAYTEVIPAWGAGSLMWRALRLWWYRPRVCGCEQLLFLGDGGELWQPSGSATV